MRPTLVFDVNETLIDLAALDPLFAAHLGDAALRRAWFGQTLQSALLSNVLGDYQDFAVMAAAALDLTAARAGIALDAGARQAILDGLRNLPAHPEVPAALTRLRGHGFRLATLSNSSPAMVAAQLAHAGLADHFEAVLSVDAAACFKPARAVYDMARRALGFDPAGEPARDSNRPWLIAAHHWDTTGAIHAGWHAAFVSRPQMVLGPLDRQPEVIGRDLMEVADALIARLGGGAG